MNYLRIGILEISERIKKVDPKKEFSKPSKDFPTAVSNFKRGAKVTSRRGHLPVVSKNQEVQVQGLTTLRMWNASKKCHKKGHYANKCPEIKVKDGQPPVKFQKIEDSGPKSDPEAKSVRQIRNRGGLRVSPLKLKGSPICFFPYATMSFY